MKTVKHPEYEAGEKHTVENYLAGTVRTTVRIIAMQTNTRVEFLGNTLTQAMTVWANNGRGEVIQVEKIA